MSKRPKSDGSGWKSARSLAANLSAVFTAAVALFAAAGAAAQDLRPSGTVTVEQTQIAFIGSGNLGGGSLEFQGRSYPFTIGGLGVGGIGISTMSATGTVYNLTEVAKFPGAYGAARYGAALGERGGGKLWLQNPNGVVIGLETKRKGVALSLGADAIYIDLD